MQEAALINTGIQLGIVHNIALTDPPINILGLQIFQFILTQYAEQFHHGFHRGSTYVLIIFSICITNSYTRVRAFLEIWNRDMGPLLDV
jgi:hypothetical protein